MFDIVTIPSPTLRERSRELEKTEILDLKTQDFIAQMIPAMYNYDGIGLAAPQVGKNIRVCVIAAGAVEATQKTYKGFSEEDTPHIKQSKKISDLILINPSYQKLSKKTTNDTEGCLSVPGFFGTVKRYNDIYVTALNVRGEAVEFSARGFFARVIQHEIDHLNGVLFIDRAVDLYEMDYPIKTERKISLELVKKFRQAEESKKL